jgi:hypothetical protein
MKIYETRLRCSRRGWSKGNRGEIGKVAGLLRGRIPRGCLKLVWD